MAELFTTRDGRALCDLRERRGARGWRAAAKGHGYERAIHLSEAGHPRGGRWQREEGGKRILQMKALLIGERSFRFF